MPGREHTRGNTERPQPRRIGNSTRERFGLRVKDGLSGPDTEKEHPEENTETDDADPKKSPDAEFKFYTLAFFLFAGSHSNIHRLQTTD
jgi:hypothetical protein